jgi:hypothetical protein
MAKRKFAWSYSRLDSFEQCPRKYYHEVVKKDFQQPPSPAMADGQRQHKALEERVRDGKRLPGDLIGLDPMCQRLERVQAEKFFEHKIALDRDLRPVPFFDKTVWVRGVLDIAFVQRPQATIIDYKTGKRKPDSDQLKLFAALGFAVFDKVKSISTAFWWLKTKETDRQEFSVDEVDVIWSDFEPRVDRMEAAYDTDDWPEKPSGLCRGWCPVKTCQHWQPRG